MVQKAKTIRCAIYTRKSSEEGLEQEFNSLHAQREACEAYIKSQRHEGWSVIPRHYDDGGFSGGNLERPALKKLIADIKIKKIDIVVVYKVDRLSRSLSDFVQLVELLNDCNASFVSVTQQFNTSTSMGRLTLNVLLSFAQFEREVTGERIRDKIAASRQKGMWMGGCVPLGYDLQEREIIINKKEATLVRHIFEQYLSMGNVKQLKHYLDTNGYVSKVRISKNGNRSGGNQFSRGMLYTILKNPLYIGKIKHKNKQYDGRHTAIIQIEIWQAVQALLATNNRKHSYRTESKHPSLLSGLIFDDQGFAMSPAQTRKNNKYYRYYVSQALMQFKDAQAGSVTRIPAGEVEIPVLKIIIILLENPNQLLTVLNDSSLDAHTQSLMLRRAKKLADRLTEMASSELIEFYRKLIERIVVSRNQITVDILVQGLATVLQQNIPSKARHRLLIPAQLKRCGLEMRLVVEGDEKTAINQSSLKTLQEAVSKGLHWHDQLISGEVASIHQLAIQEGVDRIYIVRRLRMAYLAPDIIKAIFKSHIPGTVSFNQIRTGMPISWEEQRKLFKLN